MREIDEALARAYSESNRARQAEGVPPSPHWPARGVQSAIPAAVAPPATLAAAELQWPPLVLTLERQLGTKVRATRSSLARRSAAQNYKVILFTSCHRAEGRTTLVLTLARALSRHPLRTLVVDADLTGPMVARLLGLRPAVGLDDVVEDGQAIADALIDAPDDHLGLLPMRSAVARPRDFLASPTWTCTLARLRREFDLILVDGGPLFTGLSAALLHRSVDAAVLVHHRGMTGERAVLRAGRCSQRGACLSWDWPRHSSEPGGDACVRSALRNGAAPVRRDGQPVGVYRDSQPRNGASSPSLRTRAQSGTGRSLRSAGCGQNAAGSAAAGQPNCGRLRFTSRFLLSRRGACGVSRPKSSAACLSVLSCSLLHCGNWAAGWRACGQRELAPTGR